MRVFIVAAFAEEPFRGNPAGVCILEQGLSDTMLQDIARELQQPETAFVLNDDGRWLVRWFSPAVEVELCGHATLAASYVLWREGLAPADGAINFVAGSSSLRARMDDENRVWLSLPRFPGELESPPEILLSCLNHSPSLAARHGNRWLLEYATAAEVRDLRPDFEALANTGVRSLIVTAPSDLPNFQIISRNFAPAVGVNEDQVTGVAHTCLAAHWQSRLGNEIRCWQASRRGGGLIVRTIGNVVDLGGSAVLEFAGEWIPTLTVQSGAS